MMRIRVRIRIPFFRIFYSTTFTVLLLVCLALLVITPADVIRQSIEAKHIANVFIVAGVHILALITAAFIYASRLLTNRSVLSAIPEPWVPVQAEDVGKKVRRMIVDAWERSAIVAWDARPKHTSSEIEEVEKPSATVSAESSAASVGHPNLRLHSSQQPDHNGHGENNNGTSETTINVRPVQPPWGPISHPGWSSPSSVDLPSVYYPTVIAELPNLIEAKAVSLAPPDPVLSAMPQATNAPRFIPPDPQALALLRRPTAMGLRDYLEYLGQLGLVNPPEVGADFLTVYEYARFSGAALTEAQFRQLMNIFAELLRGMVQLDPVILAALAEEAEMESDERGESVRSSSASSSTSTSPAASISPSGSAIRYSRPSSSSSGHSRHSSRSRSLSRTPSPDSSILNRRSMHSIISDHASAHTGRLPKLASTFLPSTARIGRRSVSAGTAHTAPVPSTFVSDPTATGADGSADAAISSPPIPGQHTSGFSSQRPQDRLSSSFTEDNNNINTSPHASDTLPPLSAIQFSRSAPRMPSAQSLPATTTETTARPSDEYRRDMLRRTRLPQIILNVPPNEPNSPRSVSPSSSSSTFSSSRLSDSTNTRENA
ncbi:hypothetical protein L228DRAFT_243585 [Xylona heveae TC161]|uniref:Defect at low temperature protein 1 n=1 Tax=Xylona heveae (strain CBS 132557 / TC161) TaxID=1328760 RepID=A0A165IG53_XYLHT|nr:hypothetical protein L228DRAFT_243585 [Xylona heveae TC161]KZF24851.1 hypothetical protein L228DRAFT_243585 [Xylona heveae TC161]